MRYTRFRSVRPAAQSPTGGRGRSYGLSAHHEMPSREPSGGRCDIPTHGPPGSEPLLAPEIFPLTVPALFPTPTPNPHHPPLPNPNQHDDIPTPH